MPGELLHHLGMHAVDGEQGEVGVAELVQAPAVEAVLAAILGPPAAEAGRQDVRAAIVGDDETIVVLDDVALFRLAPLVGALVTLELCRLVGLEHFDRLVGERQHAGAGLGLGGLEVAHVV